MQPHRATLKKSKKSFKSKHRSKGQLDRADARRGGRQRVSVRSKSNRTPPNASGGRMGRGCL